MLEIKDILDHRTIAIVGCSRNQEKDAHKVPKYLKEKGYKIIPVNPLADEILGERAYPGLLEMPEKLQKIVEIVDIFRPSRDVLPIIEEAIILKRKYNVLKAVWMQLGIVNEEAAEKARKAEITVVMDRCMKIEHKRLHSSLID